MRKKIKEDKNKRGIPASDSEDEKRSGGEREENRSGRRKRKKKKKIATISCFRFIPIHQILCFRFNLKTRKTTQNSFLIHIYNVENSEIIFFVFKICFCLILVTKRVFLVFKKFE